MALFHDRFIDLKKELRQILNSKQVRVINGYVGVIPCKLWAVDSRWSFGLSPAFPSLSGVLAALYFLK